MIYFMRHGLDDERFIGGHSDVPLVSEGEKQVVDAGKFIVDNSLVINKIYSSDIKRAIQSSLIINSYLNLDVIQKSYLRELDKGYLTGMNIDYVKEYYSEYVGLKDINKRYPNGESMLDFYKRIKRDLKLILSTDNILVVTHRGVINMLYFILNNEELNLDKEKFGVTHASIHEYDPKLKLIKKIY